MDFNDTPVEAAFRTEARVWLEANAGPFTCNGSFVVSGEGIDPDEEPDWVRGCRDWQRRKYEGGFGAIQWPEEWGGRGATLVEELIFREEEANFDVATGAFMITLGMIAPTIRIHGTPEQREHLWRILAGDEIWCQMFSEPEAGSDLANIQTRAVRDGDTWVITGQKVWTSGAHYADWGYLLARTDPDVPKHKGLTAFIVPMSARGITIRPLRQITGSAPFNEVFLDEVVVPDAQRLGEPGQGWRVAVTTLMNERFTGGILEGGERVMDGLLRLARGRRRNTEPLVRQRLARIYTLLEIQRLTNSRTLTAVGQGREPGPEGSVSKLAAAVISRAVGDLGVDMAEADGILDGHWAKGLQTSFVLSIGGGTNEVMRNILAERVLGLPPEPPVDR